MTDQAPNTTDRALPFVVQYLSDLYDYPEWVESERVPTIADGEAVITARLDSDYERRVADYERWKPRAEQARDLYARRKAVLEQAGLWIQPGEDVPPLIRFGGVMTGSGVLDPSGDKPVRGDRAQWRVVPASDVDDE